MVIELKNGQTKRFDTNDISKFYFTEVVKSYDGFAISSDKVKFGANYNEVCRNEFGYKWRQADWTDLKAYYSKNKSLTKLAEKINFVDKKHSWVTRSGKQRNSAKRDYFASYFNHKKSGGYLAHDNINNHLFSLGSWNGTYYVLCNEN